MYIDTHCHLSKDDYDDISNVVKENRENGIDKMVISGCSKESIKEAMEYAREYDNIYVTIGYHPEEVDKVNKDDLLALDKLLGQGHKKIVGVGEIGLDFHYDKDKKNEQINLFEQQLKLAEKWDLPVVIHSRDATMETINCLKKFNVKGIIHCFGGSLETAKIYIKMGFKLGIGGIITFKNSNLYKVVQEIGIENIVLETDSPYLTPEPYRGKKNSSKYIPLIAQRISEVCQVSVDEVGRVTSNNAKTLFDLN